MEFNSIKDVEKYLDHIPKFSNTGTSAANFRLSRFRNFCERIGNPQKEFASIHVGGTNGKGSTCHILGTIYQKSGFKVGLYTSPHILRFNERFKINGKAISDGPLVTFFQRFGKLLEDHKLTYFEISTAIAFWWFAQSKVDLAIVEVGLGGRLDATNIIDPLASVITSISLDHTNILGEHIEDIAREKGGIIKAGKPVIMGDLPGDARRIISQIAQKKGSKLYSIDEFNPQYVKAGQYGLRINGEQLLINTNLAAPIQAKNLAMAWRVTQLVNNEFPVQYEQFIKALRVVELGVGRFEKLLTDRRWYFDGGHNPEAVQALKQSIQAIGQINEAVLILSLMRDKIQPDLMTEFLEFKNIYYYQLNLERAATFNDINQWLPNVLPIPSSCSHQSFLNDFDSELVIFAGSFYFYETVREWIKLCFKP